MNEQKWLRLGGTRFRCTPLYVPIDDLDPLERMFLEVLHQERSVSRLVRAFGLSERVVEDVLGDLIRRNRAMLVIHDGVKEIAPIENAIPNPIHTRGEVLDVWQDGATGLVLPAWLVDPFERSIRSSNGESKGRASVVTLPPSSPLVEGFSTAPDSQLIEMLIRADPDIWRHEEVDAELDRLVDRYRVRPQAVWLPIIEAHLQGRTILQMAAERIPSWAARTWSAALRREVFRDASEELEYHAAATTDDEGQRIVHGWRVGNRLSRWREAIDNLLHMLPPPVSGYDLREIRERGAEIRGLLASIGEIELCDPPGSISDMEWLQPVIENSSEWMILVLPNPRDAQHVSGWLQSSFKSGLAYSGRLITVTAEDALGTIPSKGYEQPDGSSRCDPPAIRRPLPQTWPTIAIGDGLEVRVQFGCGAPVVRFYGEDLVTQWLGVIQTLTTSTGAVPTEEANHSEPLRQLRVRRIPRSASQAGAFEINSSTVPVSALIDEISGFEGVLLTAIVDPESVASRSGDKENADSQARGKVDRHKPLIQQLPFLVDQCDEICQKVSLPLRSPGAVWAPISNFEYIPTVTAVLTEATRRSVSGTLHILTNGIVRGGLSQGIVELLKLTCVERGWTVQIGFPRDATKQSVTETVPEKLASLRANVASPRLRLWQLSSAGVVSALVLDDLVFLAVGDWMSVGLGNSMSAKDCGFMVESRDFAENLRLCFQKAKEVLG